MRLFVSLLAWLLRAAYTSRSDLVLENLALRQQLATALVHDSTSVSELPMPAQGHPTRWLSGIPSAAMVFRMRQPTLASTLCPCSVRLRITGPMMGW
jgi:hypothetical protein